MFDKDEMEETVTEDKRWSPKLHTKRTPLIKPTVYQGKTNNIGNIVWKNDS
jgi:hypothetical protein